MGNSHNNALDYISEASGFPYLTCWQLYCRACSYNDQYFDATTPSETEYNNLQSEIPDLVSEGKNAPYICYLDGIISWETKLKLDTLFNIMYLGYEEEELITPDDMDDLIWEYEQKFLKEDMTVEECLDEHNLDGIIIATCVISRYSYRYWYDAVYEEGPWESYLERNGGLTYGCFWKKAWCDIKGFFSGCGEEHDAYCNPIPPSPNPFHHHAWDPVCAWHHAKQSSGSVVCE